MRLIFLSICFCIFTNSSNAQFTKEWKTYYSESFATDNSNFKKDEGRGKQDQFALKNGRVEILNTDYSSLICSVDQPMVRCNYPIFRIMSNIGFSAEKPTTVNNPNKTKTYGYINWQMADFRYGSSYYNLIFQFTTDGNYYFTYYNNLQYGSKDRIDFDHRKESQIKQSTLLKKGVNQTNEITMEIEFPKVRFYFNQTLADSVSIEGLNNDNDYRQLTNLNFSNSLESKMFIDDINVACYQYKPQTTKGSLADLFPIIMNARGLDISFTPFIGKLDSTCHKNCNRDYYLPTSLQLSYPKSFGKVSPQKLNFTIPMANSTKADYDRMENLVKTLYNSILPLSAKQNLVGKIEKVQMEQDGDKVLVGFFYPKTNLNFDLVRIYYDNRGVHIDFK